MGEIKPTRMEEDEEVAEGDTGKEMTYEEKLTNVNTIAKPMAPKKLTKKIYKCIKKGTRLKYQIFTLYSRVMENAKCLTLKKLTKLYETLKFEKSI